MWILELKGECNVPSFSAKTVKGSRQWCMSTSRTHVNKHAFWFQKTLHPAAPFIEYLFSSNHVIWKHSVWYGFLEYYDTVVFYRQN